MHGATCDGTNSLAQGQRTPTADEAMGRPLAQGDTAVWHVVLSACVLRIAAGQLMLAHRCTFKAREVQRDVKRSHHV